MVFPQLHIEIGLVNNVLDSFYLFVDDQVEAPTEEEKCSRNSYIVADVALTRATEKLNEWKEVDANNLDGYRDEVSRLKSEMGAMNEIERAEARNEIAEIQQEIQSLVQKNNLENNVRTRRAALQVARQR